MDIFDLCVNGICKCIHRVGGATAQLKPCRVYAEAMDRGGTVLKGACFGYRVIDPECVSSCFQSNYSSITKGLKGYTMG